MTNSFYKIYLDVHSYGSKVLLKAKKGDTGSLLFITLMDGRNPYVITPECYAVFTAKKADGKVLYNKCTMFENMIVYEFTPQTTSCVGKVECEIKLYGSSNQLLTSAEFTLSVLETVYNADDEVGSEKEVSALTELVSKATTLVTEVEYKLATGAFVGPQGISGVVVYPEGHFALEVDSATGDLYCVTEENANAPTFTLDENGNLYYEIEEG